MVRPLSPAELARRARSLRLLVSDVDGVLTDAGVYYSARGEELKRFSMRDGMGVERLREAGIATALLTRENSEIVLARAAKLRITNVQLGVHDKLAHFPALLADAQLAPEQVAYIGDDLNDLELLERVAEAGLSAAPADAAEELLGCVHFVAAAPGGHGAFRQFADFILRLRRQEPV
jgi:3-deoxy-D-manno-octulosonate 8-phosphate phosphatase (KDO 8-P phosphatase)